MGMSQEPASSASLQVAQAIKDGYGEARAAAAKQPGLAPRRR
jgi:hypothetical protein